MKLCFFKRNFERSIAYKFNHVIEYFQNCLNDTTINCGHYGAVCYFYFIFNLNIFKKQF